MATFFGEILPVISRAVTDEEEDEVAPVPRPLFIESTSDGDTDSLPCDNLIVAVGSAAWYFVEYYFDLCASNKVAVIREVEDNDGNGYEIVSRCPRIVASFHKTSMSKSTSVFASCVSDVPAEQVWPLANKILGNVKGFREVFVLTSSTLQDYKCDDSSTMEPPFVRCLSTTAAPVGHPVFPFLEQPNMLKNVAAAVMSACTVRNIPVVGYVCYSENMHIDVSSVNAFVKLLETPQFGTSKTVKASSNVILRNIKNSYAGSLGLYT